jgi:hypothetical protein
MIDTEALVYAGLCSDPVLVFLLSETANNKKIFNLITDQANVFPRVIFSKYLESEDSYADDNEVIANHHFQIDIINQGDDVEDIADEVEVVMLSLWFRHGTSAKIVTDNDKTKIIEKHITFVRCVDTED